MATDTQASQTPKRPSDSANHSVDQVAKDIHVEDQKLGSRERVPKPEGVKSGRILWEYVIPVIAFHLLIPLAFFSYLFSWWGVLFLPVGNYIFTSMGIGAGYHRLLTHKGFNCPKWFEYTLATLGVCSFQDSPARLSLIHI